MNITGMNELTAKETAQVEFEYAYDSRKNQITEKVSSATNSFIYHFTLDDKVKTN